MRNTKPGQFNLSGGPNGQVIDPDSDPRTVREMRDLCIRWLDERAAEDAFMAEDVRASIDNLTTR
jgi:hypothetical protein